MKKTIENIKNKSIDLNYEMKKYILQTSAQCFLSMNLTDEFIEALTNFNILLNKMTVLS